MFPAEKPMILNSLARGITGHPTINQGISLTTSFSEDVIDKIAESAWGRFWTIFTSFGTTSAGLIGLIIIIRGIKLIAFWDSVTNLYLHLGTHRPYGPPPESHQELLTA